MSKAVKNFNLRGVNTFRIDATASRYVEYSSARELAAAVGSGNLPKPYLLLGGGSNMLFTSSEFRGTVLHSLIDSVEYFEAARGKVLVRVGAGKCLDELISEVCAEGLWGMENLSGIPGGIGAATVGNVGAYGVEISSCIDRIYCFDLESGKQVVFKTKDCAYGYRYSIFKSSGVLERRYVILYVDFVLKRKAEPVLGYGDIKARVEEVCAAEGVKVSPSLVRSVVLATRAGKLPDVAEYGSAGSFFKNPVISGEEFKELCERVALEAAGDAAMGGAASASAGAVAGTVVPHYDLPDGRVKVPAAFLIEKAGYKGVTKGNVGSWPRQPLVLYNATGEASAEEVVAFAREIIDAIREKFNVTLETEVEYV